MEGRNLLKPAIILMDHRLWRLREEDHGHREVVEIISDPYGGPPEVIEHREGHHHNNRW